MVLVATQDLEINPHFVLNDHAPIKQYMPSFNAISFQGKSDHMLQFEQLLDQTLIEEDDEASLFSLSK